MIYLDSAATSEIDKEVFEAMVPFLSIEYGNPSAKYYNLAKNASAAVESARESVARLIGAPFESIVFTAGATESTNFIIKGYMDYRKYYGDGNNHIVTTTIEHKATLNVCKFLNGEIYSNEDATFNMIGESRKVDRGYRVSFVDADSAGAIDPRRVEKAIERKTALISTIWVNNETGSITDVKTISKICKKYGVAYHIDATQALGKMSINVSEVGCDYLSCSAHKIHGPKGTGAAYIKCDQYGIQPITAFLHGGEQERGYRAGTLAVHNIVGFGKAAEIALRDLKTNQEHIQRLDKYAIERLLQIDGVRLTNNSTNRLPGIISIIVDKNNFHNELFIKKVSDQIAISTGSACSAGEPSHVLKAMGLSEKTNKVLRVSLNKHSTFKEIDELISIIRGGIEVV